MVGTTQLRINVEPAYQGTPARLHPDKTIEILSYVLIKGFESFLLNSSELKRSKMVVQR